MPFEVNDFGTNRKLVCDVLLFSNTNLHHISHRYQVIVDYWSHFRFRLLTHSFGVNH